MESDAPSLQDWIGRTTEADDIVTPRLIRSLHATLTPHAAGLADGAPPGLHWCLAPDIADAGELGPDGHPAKGGLLPPVPLPRRSRIFQPTSPGHDGSMTGGSSAAFCMSSRRAAAGATVPRSMVPTPPSTIASTAGPAAGYGSASSRPWWRKVCSFTPPRSTAPTSRHTAPPTVEKGGQGAGHRPVARWPDNQDPCPDGPARAACHHPAHRRQCQRHQGGRRGARRRKAVVAPHRR
jgi:hypothetical protein